MMTAAKKPAAPALVESADEILDAEDVVFEDVVVPEWGGRTVRVRSLIGTDRDAFEAGIAGNGKKPNLSDVRAKLLVKAIVNAQGQRLFADGDSGKLGRKNAAALDRLFETARRLSGLSDKDVEELTGN